MHRCDWCSSCVASNALSLRSLYNDFVWPPIRYIISPLKLRFKKLPSPVTKMHPNGIFHEIKLTKSSSKYFRTCCLRGTAEISSVMKWKGYSTLPCKRLKLPWLPGMATSVRRCKVPLSNFRAFRNGKHLSEPRHYHFLRVKLTNHCKSKIQCSKKLGLR